MSGHGGGGGHGGSHEKEEPVKDASTSEYLSIIEAYHTPENKKKIQKKVGNKFSKLRESIDNFVWGDEVEKKKEEGATKSLKKGGDAEAENLIYNLVVNHIERKLGKKAGDAYRENAGEVKNYINSMLAPFGRTYKHLVDELINLGKEGDLDALMNSESSLLYRTLSRLAEHEVKERQIYETTKDRLEQDKHKHHDGVIEWHHKKTGLKHKVSNDIGEIIMDYERWAMNDGRYGQEFLKTQGDRFHKTTHEAYINKHYHEKPKELDVHKGQEALYKHGPTH